MYEGQAFNKERSIANNTYYQCAQRKLFKCRARVTIQADKNKVHIVNPEHNHILVGRGWKFKKIGAKDGDENC